MFSSHQYNSVNYVLQRKSHDALLRVWVDSMAYCFQCSYGQWQDEADEQLCKLTIEVCENLFNKRNIKPVFVNAHWCWLAIEPDNGDVQEAFPF